MFSVIALAMWVAAVSADAMNRPLLPPRATQRQDAAGDRHRDVVADRQAAARTGTGDGDRAGRAGDDVEHVGVRRDGGRRAACAAGVVRVPKRVDPVPGTRRGGETGGGGP